MGWGRLKKRDEGQISKGSEKMWIISFIGKITTVG